MHSLDLGGQGGLHFEINHKHKPPIHPHVILSEQKPFHLWVLQHCKSIGAKPCSWTRCAKLEVTIALDQGLTFSTILNTRAPI